MTLVEAFKKRSIVANLLILGVSASLIAWSIQFIRTRLTFVISRDAVINGAFLNINTPQEGTVSRLVVITGDFVVKGNQLVTLNNERVSRLQQQQIKSQLQQHQAQLEVARTQLERQLTLFQQLVAEKQNQYHLETLASQQVVEQVASDLKGAQARYQLAQLNYKRTTRLKAEGAISQANLDTAAVELEQRRSEVRSLEARLATLRTEQQAAQLGLTLSRTRSNFDPRIRWEELQMQIAEQRQRIQTLKQNIEEGRAELLQADKDLRRKQKAEVIAPISGVVWNLLAQEGKLVQQGESLMQLLDCNRRWVDVIVDEQALRSIQVGTPATLSLYGSTSSVLTGRVSIIRSGLGRLAPGEDVALPIALNLPRNTQVRVDLDPNTEKGSPKQFCYVGYTGRVTFKID